MFTSKILLDLFGYARNTADFLSGFMNALNIFYFKYLFVRDIRTHS